MIKEDNFINFCIILYLIVVFILHSITTFFFLIVQPDKVEVDSNSNSENGKKSGLQTGAVPSRNLVPEDVFSFVLFERKTADVEKLQKKTGSHWS